MNTRFFNTITNLIYGLLAAHLWSVDWYIGLTLLYLMVGSGLFHWAQDHWSSEKFWNGLDKSAMYFTFSAIGFYYINQLWGFDEWRITAVLIGILMTMFVHRIPTFLATGLVGAFGLIFSSLFHGWDIFFNGLGWLTVAFAVRQVGHLISHQNFFHGIWHVLAANGIRIIT